MKMTPWHADLSVSPGGQIDRQIAQVKQLETQGKRVVVPKAEPPLNLKASAAESRGELRMRKQDAASPTTTNPPGLPQP